MRFYEVSLVRDDATRTVRVPAPTGVQAADAAMPLARPGETIGEIVEVEDDGSQQADADPPRTQAGELADVTPGAASSPDPRDR